MKAKSTTVVPSGDWTVEPKMDGHRVLVHVGRTRARLYTGGGKDKTYLAPHLCESAFEQFPRGTWIDGEACAFGGSTEGWGVAQSVLGSTTRHPRYLDLQLVAFDLLAFDGEDIRRKTLRERREVSNQVKALEPIVATVILPASDKAVQQIVAVGYEGAMIKLQDGMYASGKRSGSWLKYKVRLTGDGIVMGYKDGKDSFAGMIGSIVFGQYDSEGVLRERGRCSGMDMETRRDITAHQKEYLGRPFEFAYNGRMPSGGYRHPQFRRFRSDKLPEECKDE